jgi:ATP-dependent Lhr-like helicase
MLRALGDLTAAEVAARVLPGVDAGEMLAALGAERRAVRVRLAGEDRWIDAVDAGLYRDGLGVAPPGGLPDAFLADVPDALLRIAGRFAATHGPFTTAEVRARYVIDFGPALSALERDGELLRGELRPGGSAREWCHPEVLRRLRRASLAALRKEVEPVDQRALARFMPAWQGIDRHPATGAGVDRLRDMLVTLQGVAVPPEVWERELLPRRIGAYSPAWLDALCAAGEVVWVGAGALGRTSGRVALYFREDLALLGAPATRGAAVFEAAAHALIRERLGGGACFFSDLLIDLGETSNEQLQEALWDLVWAGEVTNDAFSPLRAPRLSLARQALARTGGRRGRPGRFAARSRGAASPAIQGRWSLTASLLGSGADPAARRRATAELLLERYGVLTREQVLADGIPGGFSAIYSELTQLETLGTARRGYFVEGLGGAQFALPGAVERLREQRSGAERPLVLSAVDPAQPYGGALRWPERVSTGTGTGTGTGSGAGARTPGGRGRVNGAYVVLTGGEPILYLERGGRALSTLVRPGDSRLPAALGALVAHVRAGRIKRVALEKVDGEPALGSALGPALVELGFQEGPRRLTLSA